MPNNKRYFKMKVVGISTNIFETHEAPNSLNLVYVRIDSSSTAIYQYYKSSPERVIDSLLVKKGDEIYRLAVCTDINSKSYFGNSPVITKSLRNALTFDDFDFNWDIAYGLGEVKRFYYIADPYAVDYQNILTYAKINGVEYGTRSGIFAVRRTSNQSIIIPELP